jgi:hypothetical protein
MTFTVAPLTSYTYVYIHVSHVYKLACTLHRTINLLPLSALSSHIRHLIMEYHGTVSRSKWATRAWTYQEFILSKRVVFFLDTRIFWQCECATWDKDYLRPKQEDEAESMVSFNSGPTRSFSVPAGPDFGLYADLICPYNGRDLSYSKDGLSACSGILNSLAPAFPNGFLFGIPRIYLDHALLWQPLKAHYESPKSTVITDGIPGKTSLSTRRYTLPSWAWCGWQCFVDPRSFQAALNLGQDSRYRGDMSDYLLYQPSSYNSKKVGLFVV